MTVKGKACGKFILLGEHFVIGEQGLSVPALAFPLQDLWCEVRISPDSFFHYKAELPENAETDVVESLMARATYAAADSFRVDISAQPLRVVSRTNFPVSRGFGSSAAFSVALARAFDEYRKTLVDTRSHESASWDELVRATTAVERIFHGKPSGVDAATILSGRPIRFEKGAVFREVRNSAVDFVVVDSGSRDNCSSLVRQVGEFRERNPEQWRKMAERVRSLVDQCESALNQGDAQSVGKSVREGHGVLAELGLSSPVIDAIIGEAEGAGALAGKVSGAGGGGAVLLVAKRGQGLGLAQAMRDQGRSVVAIDLAENSK